jgi:integration host factor subunit beta
LNDPEGEGGRRMNKSQLIERIAKEEGITIKSAASVVNIVFDSMTDSLGRGDRVEIRGFGSFKVKGYDSYQGRNPKTGEIIQVREKKLPYFKVGKEMKERVDG